MKTKTFITVLLIMALSACSFKQAGGTFGGVVGNHIGGSIGKNVSNKLSRTLISTAGTLAGAWVGAKMGSKLDEESYRRMEKNAQDTLESNADGDVGSWDNPNNDASGTVSVNKTEYIEELQMTCRGYTETVTVEGKTKARKGQACRDKDGLWSEKL